MTVVLYLLSLAFSGLVLCAWLNETTDSPWRYVLTYSWCRYDPPAETAGTSFLEIIIYDLVYIMKGKEKKEKSKKKNRDPHVPLGLL